MTHKSCDFLSAQDSLKTLFSCQWVYHKNNKPFLKQWTWTLFHFFLNGVRVGRIQELPEFNDISGFKVSTFSVTLLTVQLVDYHWHDCKILDKKVTEKLEKPIDQKKKLANKMNKKLWNEILKVFENFWKKKTFLKN